MNPKVSDCHVCEMDSHVCRSCHAEVGHGVERCPKCANKAVKKVARSSKK